MYFIINDDLTPEPITIAPRPPPPPLLTMPIQKAKLGELKSLTTGVPLPNLTPVSLVNTVDGTQINMVDPMRSPVSYVLTSAPSTPLKASFEALASALGTPDTNSELLKSCPPTLVSQAQPKEIITGQTAVTTTSSSVEALAAVTNNSALLAIKPQIKIEQEETPTSSASSSEVLKMDFDIEAIMQWKDGIGTLPNSNLKFIKSDGQLIMYEVPEEKSKSQKVTETEPKGSGNVDVPIANTAAQEGQDTSDDSKIPRNPPKLEPEVDPNQCICSNCGTKGLRRKFIRNGRFCGQDCATIQSTHLRMLASGKLNVNNINGLAKLRNGSSKVFQSRNAEVDGENDEPKPFIRNRTTSLLAADKESKKRKAAKAGLKPPLTEAKKDRMKRLASQDRLLDSAASSPYGHDSPSAMDSEDTVEEMLINTNESPAATRPNSPLSQRGSLKASRPNTPSSSAAAMTPQSVLQQSIMSAHVNQQRQQDVPLNWHKSTSRLLAIINKYKPLDIMQWTPEKVAELVNAIPGCNECGPTFQEEVSL